MNNTAFPLFPESSHPILADLIAQDAEQADAIEQTRLDTYFDFHSASSFVQRHIRKNHRGQRWLLSTTELSAERSYHRMRACGSCISTDGVNHFLAGRRISDIDFMDLIEIGALTLVREERRRGARRRLYRAARMTGSPHRSELFMSSLVSKLTFTPIQAPIDFAALIGAKPTLSA